MTQEEKIIQANRRGHYDICPDCNQVVPVGLSKFNPDEDEEDNIIECLICGTAIRFIENKLL